MKTPLTPITHQHAEASPDAGMHALRATGNGVGLPPSGNTGGKLWECTDPESGERFLICPRGNGTSEVDLLLLPADGSQPYSAISDYVNISLPFSEKQEPLETLFQNIFSATGDKFAPAVERHRGLHGYKRSFKLGDTSAQLGIGGQNGTVLISLPGEACSLISDWKKIVSCFRDNYHGRITRWDGAVDDYEGAHSVNYAVELYQSGQFNTGGNKPSCNQNGNWIEPDGKGRTFYVGKRKNGKMMRVYEKGMQLGSLWHPWTRWEVEIHNKDRVVPWEVLLEPGSYLVGAYPKALRWVQEEMSRIRTIQKQLSISYDYLASHFSNAYGHFLRIAVEIEGSAENAINKLQRSGVPRRLKHPITNKPSSIIKGECQ